MDIYTIGYGNRKPDDFLAILKDKEIKTVIDVRREVTKARIGSYLPHYLALMLHNNDIDYQHQHILSNKFVAYQLDESLKLYEDWLLGTNEADDILEDVKFNIEHYYDSKVAIMCAELKPDKCHRKIIADELSRRLDCKVVHL